MASGDAVFVDPTRRAASADPEVPVEEVLLAVGDQVEYANLSYASRMNRGVVVFVKEERYVADLLASGVTGTSAGVPTLLAVHPGHRLRCSPVYSRRSAGAEAALLRVDGDWLQDDRSFRH